MLGSNFGEDFIKVADLLKSGGIVDLCRKPLAEGISADNGCVLYPVVHCKVMTFSFPSNVGSAEFVWRNRAGVWFLPCV